MSELFLAKTASVTGLKQRRGVFQRHGVSAFSTRTSRIVRARQNLINRFLC
jgi:hypothetical protein